MARLKGRLIQEYQEYHRRKRHQYRGDTTKRYVAHIAEIIREIETTSILDYGCGKGTQYTEDNAHESWGIMPTLFDPGVPGLEELPEGQFDGVVCTGVLEHIPQGELRLALGNLAKYARKWCFILVGVRVSKKRLSNGMPVHVTLQTRDWWANLVCRAFEQSPAAVWFGADWPRPPEISRLR